ncbi:hypothetical protein HMPREF1318_3083 [Actinomyces massiliensis F0489]|uniref:Uncharacterized protein n=1 Tax=Actinomyces massiliensis F0489 TaxID=1125718 RepID=J0NKB4_9ACTO|nr:hypothetical protein HMPREF1318_3083 [Actinomyces massiliensis F0489]
MPAGPAAPPAPSPSTRSVHVRIKIGPVLLLPQPVTPR